MKKKLEAELISIAHRILKLKNRAELDVLRDETLKLYEKLSVLKFVEDNFSDVKPTIGYASAEAKLDDIYSSVIPKEGSEDVPNEDNENKSGEGVDTDGKPAVADEEKDPEGEAEVTAGEETGVAETEAPEDTEEKPGETATEEAPKAETEEETKEDDQTEQPKEDEDKEDKENAGGEGVDTDGDGKAPVAPEEEAAQELAEKEDTEAEHAKEVAPAEITIDAEVGLHPEEEVAITTEPELPTTGGVNETEGQDKDNGAGEGVETPGGKPAVSTEEKKNTEASGVLDFGYEKKTEPVKQKEISFEDFHDYKEPEFVKKGSIDTPAQPKAEETDDWRNWQPNKTAENPAPPKEEPKAEAPKYDPISDWRNWEPNKSAPAEQPKAAPAVDDWMNWEPSKPAGTPAPETPKEEPKPAPVVDDWKNWEPSKSAGTSVPETPKEESKAAPVVDDWKNWEPAKTETPKPETTNYTTPAAPEPAAAPKVNGGFVRAMSLGLNDRIAFEKNLFGGSSEDLNRVVSQLNTLNTFEEAKDFIADLVKPDYNNWKGKEEFEERFMQLVEKKFSNV